MYWTVINLHWLSKGRGVACFGNFDGIHIGHQKIIQKLVNESKKMNVQTIEGKIFLSKNYLKPIFLLLTKSIVIKT
jgi:FAD synthase